MIAAAVIFLGIVLWFTVLPAYSKATNGGFILTYHKIDPGPSDNGQEAYTVSPDLFRAQMQWLGKNGFRVISLVDLLHGLSGGKALQKRSAVITFDDGYLNNAVYSFPVLAEMGYPATVFIVAESVGGVNSWDTREGFEEAALMGWEDLGRAQAQGISVGCHGLTHQRLSSLDRQGIRKELRRSREILEDTLGKPVEVLCYPYGAYNADVIEELQSAGFRGGCCNIFGRNIRGGDPYQLRRIQVESTDSPWRLRTKIQMSVFYETYRILRQRLVNSRKGLTCL
jgi:peptidoglycan/xylan/chitin deacetylase (PgdA/CDA1 family)